jgi:capsular polysaccharide biosynthesis protein
MVRPLEEAPAVTLRDYVLVVARSWIVIVVTVAVGLVTAGVIAFTATTKYTSSAQVLFTGHATTSGQDLAYVGNYVQSRMQTYKNLGTSTSMLESVAGAIGTDESPRELADRTDISVSQLNTVATVTAKDTTAKGAAETANTLAGALVETVRNLEADNAEQQGASDEGEANATIQGVITGTAEAPSSPSDPDIPLYLLAGLLAGLVVSILVVALREVLRGETSASTHGEAP